MKNRIELAQYFNQLGFKRIAEVGVFDGHYSQVLCQQIPGVKLYAIDPWVGYQGYRDHKFKESFDRAEKMARERLAPYDCEIIKKFSVDAAKDFEDGSLDAVFIDGNHEYKYVKEDIELWAPKVKVGGIVSGHDYYKTPTGNVGVINAVDEFINEYGYKLEITDWDNDNPVRDDRQPCWWVRK